MKKQGIQYIVADIYKGKKEAPALMVRKSGKDEIKFVSCKQWALLERSIKTLHG